MKEYPNETEAGSASFLCIKAIIKINVNKLLKFQNNIRDKANIMYNSTLPVIFGVKKYAARLMEVVKDRLISIIIIICHYILILYQIKIYQKY